MPAVRGGVEDDVVRPPLDAAFQRRLQRFVGCVAGVEGEVVAEEDEALRPSRGRARISSGRLSMSSRWISTSFSGGAPFGRPRPRRARPSPASSCPCRARPRAARCWPAGRRRNASCCRSACRASGRCPSRSASATRLTLATGCRPVGAACQTNASAAREVGRQRRRRREPLQRLGDPFEHVAGRVEAFLQAPLPKPTLSRDYHAPAGRAKRQPASVLFCCKGGSC